ncbi:MAG: coiled-coil domain-containing protein [Pseudomonadota bacterium]
MQRAYMFDTFQYVKELTKAGVQQEQAEVQVKLMVELINHTLCTRDDLERSEERLSLRIEDSRKDLELKVETVRKDLELKIESVRENLELKIETVRKELKVEIENLRKDLALQINQAKHEMIKWLIGISAAGLGLLFTMIRFCL